MVVNAECIPIFPEVNEGVPLFDLHDPIGASRKNGGIFPLMGITEARRGISLSLYQLSMDQSVYQQMLFTMNADLILCNCKLCKRGLEAICVQITM